MRVLGRGGFGITYLAFDLNLNGAVALKEYFPAGHARRLGNGSVGPRLRKPGRIRLGPEELSRRGQAIHRLDHPNVVRARRYFKERGSAFIVMDYVEGDSLEEILRQRSKLTFAEWQPLLGQLLDGLEHIHDHDYLHRDLKPRKHRRPRCGRRAGPHRFRLGADRSRRTNQHTVVHRWLCADRAVRQQKAEPTGRPLRSRRRLVPRAARRDSSQRAQPSDQGHDRPSLGASERRRTRLARGARPLPCATAERPATVGGRAPARGRKAVRVSKQPSSGEIPDAIRTAEERPRHGAGGAAVSAVQRLGRSEMGRPANQRDVQRGGVRALSTALEGRMPGTSRCSRSGWIVKPTGSPGCSNSKKTEPSKRSRAGESRVLSDRGRRQSRLCPRRRGLALREWGRRWTPNPTGKDPGSALTAYHSRSGSGASRRNGKGRRKRRPKPQERRSSCSGTDRRLQQRCAIPEAEIACGWSESRGSVTAVIACAAAFEISRQNGILMLSTFGGLLGVSVLAFQQEWVWALMALYFLGGAGLWWVAARLCRAPRPSEDGSAA